jgi:dTMP kinase
MTTPSKLGTFISIEGIDGCGKTSNLDFISKTLIDKGYKTLIVRDPGSTLLGETLRAIVLTNEMTPLTELLLFSACRQELVETLIKPAMAKGIVVISDRFSDSTFAYQACLHNLHEEVNIMETLIGDGFKPNHTIFLDITLEESLRRINNRVKPSDKTSDKFDSVDIRRKKLIQGGYLERAILYKDRINTISAMGNLTDVQARLKLWLDVNY